MGKEVPETEKRYTIVKGKDNAPNTHDNNTHDRDSTDMGRIEREYKMANGPNSKKRMRKCNRAMENVGKGGTWEAWARIFWD